MGKLLVIEDDSVIAELLASVLAEGGYEADTVPSLEMASDGPYALVITDLLSTDAYDLRLAREWVERVRGRFAGVPLIVCTAHAQAEPDADAIGADAVLPKPFDVDALLALVLRLAGGSSTRGGP